MAARLHPVNPVLGRLAAGTVTLLLLLRSVSAYDAAGQSTVTLEPAAKALEQIEAIASLSGQPVRERVTGPDGLIVWPERMWISSTNINSPDSVRYVTMKLSLTNTTKEPVLVERRGIVLLSGATKLVANEVPASARTPLRTDGIVRQHSQLQAPDETAIPPDKSASIWCVFAPVPAHPSVPPMLLQVSSDESTHTVDLNELARLKLGLTVETIGPQDCLGLLHVRGHLDSISAAELADQLTRLATKGTERAVVYWEEHAEPIDPVLMNWLLSSTAEEQRSNPFYAAMPKIPSLRELHVARIPADADDMNIETDLSKAHEQPSQAAEAALNTLLPWVGYDHIAEELLRGHDWVRAAILRNERVDLPPQALEVVSSLIEGGSPEVRLAAIDALSRINDRRAIAIAKRFLLESTDLETRKGALESLVNSSAADAIPTVLQLLQDGTLPESEWVLLRLAEAAHAEFSPWIIERTRSADPPLRRAALRALNRSGHPQRIDLTIQALQDADASVRSTAFEALAKLNHPRAQEAAVDYALRTIRSASIDDAFETIVALIGRTRDPRFAEALFELLPNQDDAKQSRIISLLGIVGDERTAKELVARFSSFRGDARESALQVLSSLAPESAVNLAAQLLLSDQPQLSQTAAEVLQMDGSDASVAVLEKALAAASEEQQPMLADALAGIATPAARNALIRFRDRSAAAGESKALKFALANLQLLQTHSPGWQSREAGRYRYQEEAYEQAIRHLKLAVEIDPQLSEAYSFMGNTYLKLLLAQMAEGENDLIAKYRQEAGTSFRRALELDPYDGQAITGVGIITAMEGKPEQAVQLVTDAAHRCPDDFIFEYNTACVYGRAIEALQKRPHSPEGEQLITEYGEQGIAHLKRSLELGFNQFDLMATDPDIDTLRDLPAFRTLRE